MSALSKLADWLEALPDELEEAIEQAAVESAKEGVKIGQFFSSGRYSLPQLAKMGHPYGGGARPYPVPYGDRRFVNEQTGNFYQGWFAGLLLDGAKILPAVMNHTPEASFLLGGNPHMERRRIDELLIESLLPVTESNIMIEIGKVLK